MEKKTANKKRSRVMLFVVALFILNVILLVANSDRYANILDLAQNVGLVAATLVFAVVGGLILMRQNRNVIGLLLMVFPVMLTVSNLLDFFFFPELAQAQTLDAWLFVYVWFSSWSWWLLIAPLLLIFLLYPTGQLLSKRWRWAVLLLGAAFALFLFVATFAGTAESVQGSQTWPNPIGFLPEETVGLLIGIMTPMLLGSVLIAVTSVFLRYRRAQAVERAQLRWLFFAGAFFLVVYTPGFIVAGEGLGSWFDLLFLLGVVSVPIAIGVAILRYRLWDIDFVINRSLVYGVLTTLLAGIFAGTAAVATQVAKALFGAELESASAAVAAIMVAALFQPLRAWVEGGINRRLFPENIDLTNGLIEISPDLWSWVSLPTILDATLAHLEDIYTCESAAIYLERKGSYHPTAARGLPKTQLSVYKPSQAEKDALIHKKTIGDEKGLPFVLTVPIYLPRRKEPELLGVLRLGKRKQGRGYSGDDAKTLVSFGAKLARPLYALSSSKKS